MEKAIKLAKSAGWIQQLPKFVPNTTVITNPDLLDPLFFQALGKTEGWTNMRRCPICTFILPSKANSKKEEYLEEWKYHWHRFIDHLAEGGLVDRFFDDLLI